MSNVAVLDGAEQNGGYVKLTDLVLPGQLNDLLQALEQAPELTDTLLYSIIQLMDQPEKVNKYAKQPADFLTYKSNRLESTLAKSRSYQDGHLVLS
jgi:hypothetical protein